MNPHDNLNIATPNPAKVRSILPLTDIVEGKKGATLYIDMPGVSRDSIDIGVDHNVLTISGDINLGFSDEIHPTYMDVKSERFERRFTLGEELDCEKIEANYEQGELIINIPRLERHLPKKIHVNVE